MTEPNRPTTPIKEEEATAAKKFGTHVMGPPAVPTVHPEIYSSHTCSTRLLRNMGIVPLRVFVDGALRVLNFAVRTGPSLAKTAWGKMNLTAKVLSQGGYESLFKQICEAEPNERLNKTFACYLSTTTGPVAGTIYLSASRLAFCSDRPLSFIAPSGQENAMTRTTKMCYRYH